MTTLPRVQEIPLKIGLRHSKSSHRVALINNGVVKIMRKKTIKEILEETGFDKTRPMVLSGSDQTDLDDKGDVFRDWYEEELRELYER